MANRQTALVTGASGGIGLDLARLLARDQYDLFLVARSEKKLREIAAELKREHSITAVPIYADLSRPDAAATVFSATAGKPVDVLVNNAGFGLSGAFHETNVARSLEMIGVNVVALTQLTHLCLPGMVQRGHGRILNVASTAGFQPGPFMAVYYATKAFVISLSEALAEELRATGVTVTALCPGPTLTGFAEAADMTGSKLFKMMMPMKSADVAAAGYRAMQRGQRIVVTGVQNKISAAAVRFTPRRLVTRIVSKMQER